MGITVRAEFLQLDAVRMIALVLRCRVVALFAACASHSNDYPHVYTSWTSPLNRSVIDLEPAGLPVKVHTKKAAYFWATRTTLSQGYTSVKEKC